MKRIVQSSIASVIAPLLVCVPVLAASPYKEVTPRTEVGMHLDTDSIFRTALPQTNMQPIEEISKIEITPQPAPQGSSSGCGDNFYANYIYTHESGCKLINPNSSGCDGIGQACPASKLQSVCPNMDYTCQNAYFTLYAQKYGGWEGSYNFWKDNSWW